MGHIKPEIRDSYNNFFQEENLLKPFLVGFDVTWARRRKAFNTELSMFFLKPEQFISQMFGFEHEIVLFISDYPNIEPRTMQAINSFLAEEPAKGRVDQSIFFLATPASDAQTWVADYSSINHQARISVIFNTSELIKNNDWTIRNILQRQLFSRDLFDYQLPVDNDLFFFGRAQIVADHLDAIKRSQNRGLFGLRKTGKTSILYKLGRIMNSLNLGAFLYYDCKMPAIRMLRWNQLLLKITTDICSFYKLPANDLKNDEIEISDQFLSVIKSTPANKLTALIFDEIEYISPLAVDNVHWKNDYIPFWQTLWAVQSQIRRLSNTIVGVNPLIAEQDMFDGIQNPMFGIIQPHYLKGLSQDEMRSMVKFFGRRMGISFSFDAYEYLHKRYGGHPLLTRQACSEIHEQNNKKTRPLEISKLELEKDEDRRDEELIFYCKHVVSELQKFYPEEFELLEKLACGQTIDVMDLSSYPVSSKHLRAYGLLDFDELRRPFFAIPVIGKHIGTELARKEKRPIVKRVIPIDSRDEWVTTRCERITRTLRDFTKLIKNKSLPDIFGINSFPEPEKFLSIKPVSQNSNFVVFINICNRCFVESVELYGRSQSKNNYYWEVFKPTYPDLWYSFQRIKVYRHNDLHLELNKFINEELNNFLKIDLEEKHPSQIPDYWFLLQQSVLDGLMLSIQLEINRLT